MRNYLPVFLFCLSFLTVGGCQGGSNVGGNLPVFPSTADESSQSQRVLWGLWDCSLNAETMEIEVVPLRGAEFTANVNNLLEKKPGNLIIGELDLSNYYTDGRLGCTVTLKHPFPGLDMYDGFDVWGVFIHNGNGTLLYDGLTYSKTATGGDNVAVMLNADGYTRWFNQPEFDGTGLPILEYWAGKLGNLPYPTARLNPYKIFADGLGKDEDYYTWVSDAENSKGRGIFRAGSANSRRYELQFPLIGGVPKVEFQYAVIASWEAGDPTLTGDPALYDVGDFPSSANVEEPFFIRVTADKSDLYNDGEGHAGGDFVAEIEVFDWQGGSVGGKGVPNEINRIIFEGNFIPN